MEIAYTLCGTPEGMPPTDVPGDYKQWLLTQGDIDPYLRKALKVEELLALTFQISIEIFMRAKR